MVHLEFHKELTVGLLNTDSQLVKVTSYFPVIDDLLQEMERRFNKEALKAIDGITALDPSNQFGSYSEKAVSFASCFPSDTPSNTELTTELRLFMNYAQQGNFTSCIIVQETFKYLVTDFAMHSLLYLDCTKLHLHYQ